MTPRRRTTLPHGAPGWSGGCACAPSALKKNCSWSARAPGRYWPSPRSSSSPPPRSGRPADAERQQCEKELQREQVEFATDPLTSMGEMEHEILRRRREAAARAEEAGATVAALATSPVPIRPSLDLGERHRWMAETFGLTAREQLTCGCHVHVAVDSDVEGVARDGPLRRPPLRALSDGGGTRGRRVSAAEHRRVDRGAGPCPGGECRRGLACGPSCSRDQLGPAASRVLAGPPVRA
ncbi:glutamate-cysteine ligase family protein [Streptomyces sp. NPDC006632]|uniref:glutamate-cysteine ligase family protein n=1 Tax=Streptomyces sp. NPDC006632 TaxID=3157182 RepID=UPI0033BF2C4A